jgi:hypothetical protein
MALAGAGRGAAALQRARRVEQLAAEVAAREAQYARAPGWPPRVRAWLADLHTQMGDLEAARTARRESTEMWRSVVERTDVPPDLLTEAREAMAPASR